MPQKSRSVERFQLLVLRVLKIINPSKAATVTYISESFSLEGGAYCVIGYILPGNHFPSLTAQERSDLIFYLKYLKNDNYLNYYEPPAEHAVPRYPQPLRMSVGDVELFVNSTPDCTHDARLSAEHRLGEISSFNDYLHYLRKRLIKFNPLFAFNLEYRYCLDHDSYSGIIIHFIDSDSFPRKTFIDSLGGKYPSSEQLAWILVKEEIQKNKELSNEIQANRALVLRKVALDNKVEVLTKSKKPNYAQEDLREFKEDFSEIERHAMEMQEETALRIALRNAAPLVFIKRLVVLSSNFAKLPDGEKAAILLTAVEHSSLEVLDYLYGKLGSPVLATLESNSQRSMLDTAISRVKSTEACMTSGIQTGRYYEAVAIFAYLTPRRAKTAMTKEVSSALKCIYDIYTNTQFQPTHKSIQPKEKDLQQLAKKVNKILTKQVLSPLPTIPSQEEEAKKDPEAPRATHFFSNATFREKEGEPEFKALPPANPAPPETAALSNLALLKEAVKQATLNFLGHNKDAPFFSTSSWMQSLSPIKAANAFAKNIGDCNNFDSAIQQIIAFLNDEKTDKKEHAFATYLEKSLWPLMSQPAFVPLAISLRQETNEASASPVV